MCYNTQRLIGTIPTSSLFPSYKAILKEVVTYGDWMTGTKIRPSLPTIAKSTGYSLRTVKRAKAKFLSLGLLKKTAKHCMLSQKSEEMMLDFYVLNSLVTSPVDNYGYKPKSSDTVTRESSDTVAPNNKNNIINNFFLSVAEEEEKRKKIKKEFIEQPLELPIEFKPSIEASTGSLDDLCYHDSSIPPKEAVVSCNAMYEGIKKVEEEKNTMEDKKEVFTMIGIWKEEVCKEETIIPSTKIKDALQYALTHKFDGSLDKWREYCIKVASIDFLMGQNQYGWKAQLHWAIKPEKIDNVLSGSIYQKSKPIKYNTKEKPKEITKDELLDEIFASSHDEQIKKIKVAMVDYLNASCPHAGLISFHTYLRRAEFIKSTREGKNILTINSTYNAFNGLMSFHDLLTKACGEFDEVVIYSGSNDRRGDKLYLDRKSTNVPEPIYIWEQLCVQRGIESIMTISQAMLVNSYTKEV